MTEIYKSTISYLSWEAYAEKPEWILELFEQELLFEDENGAADDVDWFFVF